ncbi:hypothetical protein [Devosia naphthalenivorans]|uniref:hypothetical protein n=1 Tax=Devosia naphthalenivorans TaxID=2082392 RepID=UPI000D36BD83|nr:hypothetical protein [Devosia naphthalenivorans]
MRTKSHISAVALAAALITTPQISMAQDLSVDLGGVGVDADVSIGGDSLVDVDAGAEVGGESGLGVDAGVSVGGSEPEDGLVDANLGVDSGGSENDGNLVDVDASVGSGSGSIGNGDADLVDVDLGIGSGSSGAGDTGPNGGTLIDLDANIGATGGGDVPATGPSGGNTLITGDIRIGSIGDDDARADALLGLIASPKLADIDLDATIDDTRVSIVVVAELLGAEAMANIEAAIQSSGDGRSELIDALSNSVELASILGKEGIDLSDVLAVQIVENGATEVIVLDRTVTVALGGDESDLANLGIGDTAELDVDLLSDEELAAVDLDLLPDDQRAEVQLRLLSDGHDLADMPVDDLANIDLDLLSDDQLASLDLDVLPETLRTPIQLRLLGDEGNLADLSVGDLAELDVGLAPGGGDSDDGDTGGGGDGNGNGGGNGDGDGGDNDGGAGEGGGGGTGTGGEDNGGANGGANGNAGGGSDDAADTVTDTAASSSAQAEGRFGIASLGCGIGVLALANGRDATPQAIVSAESLELVRIDGCERSLVDAEIDSIRSAIDTNAAISNVLEQASIPLDQVIGATIQGGTLTLFIDPSDVM